jgi:predicted peptidase
MPDTQLKTHHIVFSFDIVENVGIDTSTLIMQIDGKAVGCLSSVELSAKINDKFGNLQYTQFRNVRETENIKDTGIWELHSHGDTESND